MMGCFSHHPNARNMAKKSRRAKRAPKKTPGKKTPKGGKGPSSKKSGGKPAKSETVKYTKPETGTGEAAETLPRTTSLSADDNRELLEELPVPVLVYRAGHALFANRALLKETGDTLLAGLKSVKGA